MTSTPASWMSQLNATPVDSRARRVASMISGPVPSPGMSVTLYAIRDLPPDHYNPTDSSASLKTSYDLSSPAFSSSDNGGGTRAMRPFLPMTHGNDRATWRMSRNSPFSSVETGSTSCALFLMALMSST